jgi:hypothetical protein
VLARIGGGVIAERQKAAVVGVADHRHEAVRPGQVCDEVEHAVEAKAVGG